MGIKQFNYSFFFNHSINAEIQNKNFPINTKNNFAIPIQNHTGNVKIIKKPGIYNNIDGLISSKKYKTSLSIKIADCVPIYLYDTKNEYYGLIHSGWKGTKNKIITNALNIFFNELQSSPENILIVIGPHIKKCCYEVSWDVAQYFSYITNKNKNKWLLDLSQEIKSDILNFKIPNHNIYISNTCTYESLQCESFRRDGKKSGRMIGTIQYAK